MKEYKPIRKSKRKAYVKAIAILVSMLLVIATVVPYGAAFAENAFDEAAEVSAVVEIPDAVTDADDMVLRNADGTEDFEEAEEADADVISDDVKSGSEEDLSVVTGGEAGSDEELPAADKDKAGSDKDLSIQTDAKELPEGGKAVRTTKAASIEDAKKAEIDDEDPLLVEAAKAGDPDAEVWTVTVRNRDSEVTQTIEVIKGEAIGSQLPAPIAREDYKAYWAIGTSQQGGQQEEWVPANPVVKVGEDYVPTSDITIVPYYEKISYTVTFYEEDKTTVVTTKTVDVDTSYCLNDIPAVPSKAGNVGKWVYSEGDFSNSVKVTADMDVWAEYTQNVFTVKFMVDSDEYDSYTCFTGDALVLPADPVVEGKDFEGWYEGETKYTGGESVTSNLTLTAKFNHLFKMK